MVLALRSLQVKTTAEATMAIGKLLIDRLFGGDLEAWRHGSKAPAFRRLARHPEVPYSASVLQRAVALYDLSCRVGGIATWKHIGVSHLRAVLAVDPGGQASLLEEANARRWTVRRLQEEVARRRSGTGPRRGRGRPPVPKALRSIRHIERHLADLSETSDTNDALRDLPPAAIQEIRQIVTSVMQHCVDLRIRLD